MTKRLYSQKRQRDLSREDFQKAKRISRAIQEFLESNATSQARVTDFYDYLLHKNLIEKDRHPGLKLRKFLKRLHGAGVLEQLIPQCKVDTSNPKNFKWYFYPAKEAERPGTEQSATVLHTPFLPESEIDELIEKSKEAIDNLPKRADNFPLPQQETRKTYPRAYEKWSKKEEEYLERAYLKFGRIDKTAELLRRQPSAVESRILELGIRLPAPKAIPRPTENAEPKPKNLFQLLKQAQGSPHLHFSEMCPEKLFIWLQGYEAAVENSGTTESHPLVHQLDAFQEFVEHKLGDHDPGLWPKILLAEAEGDSKKAFFRALELLLRFGEEF